MSTSINHVVLVGNVVDDPVVKFTPSGVTVIRFSLATNRSVKKGEEWESIASFHKIVSIGKTAAFVSDKIKSGTKLYIDGRVDYRSWEGDDGQRKYMTEIFANNIIFILPKKNDATLEQEAEKALGESSNEVTVSPEDIPF